MVKRWVTATAVRYSSPPRKGGAGVGCFCSGSMPRKGRTQGHCALSYAPDPRLKELGLRWLGPADESASSWLEHRLRLGVCEGRAELGDLLWLECNAAELNGVSFSKGCFVGQENTARMNWRQKINRRLVVVETDSTGPRTRIHYPELGLTVEHRRTDDLEGAICPDWLKTALSQPSTA